MSVSIRTHDLSKRYRVEAADRPYYFTLRDSLAKVPRALVDRLRRGARAPSYFWSLDGVSFEVGTGEVVGVIGLNGAGKSTLLKVLSRITEPTRGFAEVRGRVGSLLEVGTGFHEELTGRENLFLNGAILGMRRAEIRRYFDAIVDFAELGEFVDTPVKRYSSGMYMRLAFSVAAHLQTEVLLVDEVLAVGDLAFQNKCLSKMEDIGGQGRTILFVSHNLAAIKQLCHSCVVLHHGRLAYRGPSADGVAAYLSLARQAPAAAEGPAGTEWRNVKIDDTWAVETVTVQAGRPFRAGATLHCDQSFLRGRFSCHLANAAQDTVVSQEIEHRALGIKHLSAGSYEVSVELPAMWLTPGVYSLWFRLKADGSSVSRDYESPRALLNVNGTLEGAGKSILTVPLDWQVTPSGDQVAVAR